MKAQINRFFWVSLRINTTKPWNAALVLIKEGGAPRTCSQINEVEVEELIAFWNQSRLYRILIHATCFQEVVLSADVRCTGCQNRLADMMSKMGEIESVVVNASEKSVTLVCRYPSTAAKLPSRLVPALHRNPLNKFALIKRILRSSSS